jgi:hypothetical protein
MITPKQVRTALAKEFGIGSDGKPLVTFFRSPAGYYYFSGLKGIRVASLYQFNLDGTTIQEIIDHVRERLAI